MRRVIPTGRRIAAARELAGFTSVDRFAEHIDAKGLGATTLRKYERGEERAPTPKLREIARACGLPYAFFTIDFAALDGEPSDARVASVESRLARVEGLLSLLVDPDARDEDRRRALDDWRAQGESHREEDEPGSESQAGA